MVGRYAHLDGVLVGEEVDDLERVRDDADGEELLAVVAAVHHERVDETLNDGCTGCQWALRRARETPRTHASRPS